MGGPFLEMGKMKIAAPIQRQRLSRSKRRRFKACHLTASSITDLPDKSNRRNRDIQGGVPYEKPHP